MDNPNPVSNENAAAGAAPAKPVRKRSGFEKLVVWGGILILLGLVYVEWNSRNQFDAALKSLEAAIAERGENGIANASATPARVGCTPERSMQSHISAPPAR